MGILQIKCYAISHAFLRVVSNLTPGSSLLAVQTLTVWRGRGKQPDPGASPSARKERPCVWQKYTSGRPQSASLWVVWGIGRADVGAVAGGHGAGAGCIPSEVSETRALWQAGNGAVAWWRPMPGCSPWARGPSMPPPFRPGLRLFNAWRQAPNADFAPLPPHLLFADPRRSPLVSVSELQR